MKTFYFIFVIMLTFTISIAQVSWTKYEGNPVLTPGPSGSWDSLYVQHSSVVFDGVKYHMYYTAKLSHDSHSSSIGHATSDDGISWEKDLANNPVLKKGPDGSWDSEFAGISCVLFDGSVFHMWYTGGVETSSMYRIGYATSTDGSTWTKYDNPSTTNALYTESDPVLMPALGAWDSRGVEAPFVILKDNMYIMWYDGYTNSFVPGVGRATSTDGINWIKDTANNPVLKPGSISTWEENFLRLGSVVLDQSNSVYHMFYYAGDFYNHFKIGYAASSDGINWTKYNDPTTPNSPYALSDPILPLGPADSWDDKQVGGPWVIFDSLTSTFKMWYTGADNINIPGIVTGIGFATAPLIERIPDEFKKHATPVLSAEPASWESSEVYAPCVIREGDTLKMWYTGAKSTGDDQIGYATSTDGIVWQKYAGNPVLPIGNTNSWDSKRVVHPEVIFDGTTYHMWYGGSSSTSWYFFDVGYATSQDGINWTKYDDPSTTEAPYDQSDPVLKRGDTGEWDDATFAGVTCTYDGAYFHMWYGGCDGTNWAHARIGYASSPDGINWEKHADNPVFSGSSGTWDNVLVYVPFVIADAFGFKMWYSGYNGIRDNIGFATSNDGITWDPLNTPVLRQGSSGSWDDGWVGQQSVLFDGTNYDMWYAGGRSDSDARIGYAVAAAIPTALEEIFSTPSYPDGFILNQNYPNPFNPVTTISYQIPQNSYVELSVYNLLGQKVSSLVNKKQSAGTYLVQWDASGFASGIYLYRIITDADFVQTKKLILIK